MFRRNGTDHFRTQLWKISVLNRGWALASKMAMRGLIPESGEFSLSQLALIACILLCLETGLCENFFLPH